MKREKWFYYANIFTPWFWTRCDICGDEFRKEPMWKIKYHFGVLTKRICTECAPDYDKAYYLADTWGKNGTDKPRVRNTPLEPRKKV